MADIQEPKPQELKDLFDAHSIVVLSKESNALKRVESEIQQLLLSDTHCSWGFAPELSTATHEAVYFPKDLSDKTMFDPGQDNDAPSKDALEKFFAHLFEEGEEYTELDHFVKGLDGKSEVELFMLIEGFGGALYNQARWYHKGTMEMSKDEFETMQQTMRDKQMACLPFLAPFGLVVTKETLSENRSEYNKWYCHWKAWMDGFSNSEWKTIENHLINRTITKEHLPKKKWNE